MFEKINDWVEENFGTAMVLGGLGLGVILWATGVNQGYEAREQEINAYNGAIEDISSAVAEKLK